MTTAIRIENVSKLYRLGTVGTGTIAHDLNRWWHQIRGKEDPYAKVGQVNDRTQSSTSSTKHQAPSTKNGAANTKHQAPGTKNGAAPDYVWALRDINLEVAQGEILGIIGRNGAGKSTLLKLLSRVTAPTTGSIKTKGRIASLLEVGTGFHPDLTGRENIFLNGSILGMQKSEIKRQLDAIIDFSGCSLYIDTPVKRYSSGMYVRLAFAVAAHLDPAIMIIDEVLAVGDGDFQKKCLGKMQNMHDEGRTVIVVSHQMSMITSLCSRGVVMNNGQVTFDGSAAEAVLQYQPTGGSGRSVFNADLLERKIGDERAQLHKAWAEDGTGLARQVFDLADPIVVCMEYSLRRTAAKHYYPNFHVTDEKGNYVFVTSATVSELPESTNSPGQWRATCTIPGGLLNTGTFNIGIAVTALDPGLVIAFWEPDAIAIQVTEDLSQTLDGSRNGYAGPVPGPIRPQLPWRVEQCCLQE